MRILILRTIAHEEIWEGNEHYCHYDRQSYDIIKIWEPNLISYTTDQVGYGIGIYTSQYFDYVSRSGKEAYRGTPEEDQPSLLSLRSFSPENRNFAIDENNLIKIAFSLIKKYQEFSREKMLQLDSQLLHLKKNEFGNTVPNTKYSSLCYTLDFDEVENLFLSMDISLL